MKHLVDRFREGRISVADFDALQDWLNSDPEVPPGKWYKQFPKFILAGEGEIPKTFLTSGMVPHGTEVRWVKLNRAGAAGNLGCEGAQL